MILANLWHSHTYHRNPLRTNRSDEGTFVETQAPFLGAAPSAAQNLLRFNLGFRDVLRAVGVTIPPRWTKSSITRDRVVRLFFNHSSCGGSVSLPAFQEPFI